MTEETPPEAETEESPPKPPLDERIMEAIQSVLRDEGSAFPMYAVTNFWLTYEYVAFDEGEGMTVLQHVFDTDKSWYTQWGMLESARDACKARRYDDFDDEESESC